MIENIYEKANMIHMLAIKFNIVPDNKTLKGIDDAFQYILDRGIEPLSNIVDRLTYILIVKCIAVRLCTPRLLGGSSANQGFHSCGNEGQFVIIAN